MSNNNAFKGNNNICPVGSIVYWAGKTALKEVVPNFIPCDGRSLEQADYPELFSSLGIRYGTGSGTTTFSLPDPTGQLLVAGAAANAGATVAPSRNAFATATFGITDQTFLPPFPMDYDTAAPYTGTNNYYKDGVGDENLYTDSSTIGRYTAGSSGNNYCRDDITYTNAGGIGLQATNPAIAFDNGLPAPVDITADITAPADYKPPTFNIIAMIKARN